MLRTHTCGELRMTHTGIQVTLCGWVSRMRDKGGMLWIDLRDRYGIIQLMAEEGQTRPVVLHALRSLGREYVVQVEGIVVKRYAPNDKMPTGDIEIRVDAIKLLNPSRLPPFLVEDETDGGDDLRMQYRYIDLRRQPVRYKLELRHRVAQEVRRYLDAREFLEVETPVLIKSTPEGARDFVVPSRLHKGEFYALPQSPQTFKQLLMVGGFDRYFQIVKCYRDEDLRADRQPEFTQIDCEMSFVEREDILQMFEGLLLHLLISIKGVELGPLPRLSFREAMMRYGNDKPDIRFGMELVHLKGYGNDLTSGAGFGVFDTAERVVGIPLPGGAEYTRKQLDELTEWVKRPQIGMKGMVWMRIEADGSLKSSVDKFYSTDRLQQWRELAHLQTGDLLLVMAGRDSLTLKAASALRLELGERLGLRLADKFQALWVVDFPLLEWDEESTRWMAMHHPFTSPIPEHTSLLAESPGDVLANAYDLVLNGNEVGGGSIRIHDRTLQSQLFEALGFTPEEANQKFGFLLNAFEFGAPPHGGIALGFDRLCALMGGSESIRDFIAFPKNNAGRDVMIDAPGPIDEQQRRELGL
ncbi:MAG: aspartate--tRNA ligase [Sphingomonadales bacterium]|nr:aspartate--tRNA ligase [Sphingomonadales bacterium]